MVYGMAEVTIVYRPLFLFENAPGQGEEIVADKGLMCDNISGGILKEINFNFPDLSVR